MPAGLDPRTANELGIFFVEKSIFSRPCFADVTIAHFRDNAGYTDDWYDGLDMDEEEHNYYFTIPN